MKEVKKMKINRRRVEIAMASSCVNPKEVSLLGGISYASFRRAMKGKNCKFATIGKIARALGVPVSEIVEAE